MNMDDKIVRDALSMWTVYDHPKDFPDHFVARRFEVNGQGAKLTSDVILSSDLDVLRNILAFEMHMIPMARNAIDEPQIVETWL